MLKACAGRVVGESEVISWQNEVQIYAWVSKASKGGGEKIYLQQAASLLRNDFRLE